MSCIFSFQMTKYSLSLILPYCNPWGALNSSPSIHSIATNKLQQFTVIFTSSLWHCPEIVSFCQSDHVHIMCVRIHYDYTG